MSNSLKFWQIPLSKLFFYALILLLPFNIQWARFTETSFYYGYHAFYNTMFLSLTDFIICGIILSWLIEISVKYNSPSPPLSLRGGTPPLKLRGGWEGLFHSLYTRISQNILIKSTMVFWLILAISTLASHETLLSFYGLGKITLFLGLFLFVSQKPVSVKLIFKLVLVGAVLQSIIAVVQYMNQHSLGWQFLGESVLVPMMRGIAEFPSGETVLIRAYGTFPHPNLLGVWFFIAFLAVIWLIYAQSRQGGEVLRLPAEASRAGWEGRGWGRVKIISHETLVAVSLILITVALTLTFSRAIWMVTAFSLLILLILTRFHRNKVFERMQSAQRETGAENYHPARIAWIIALLIISFGLNWYFFGHEIKSRISPPREEGFGEVIPDESRENRALFNDLAWDMAKDHPIFGLGMRNIVVALAEIPSNDGIAERFPSAFFDGRLLPYLRQPVHNIYLLVLVEAGVLGLAGFLWVLYEIIRNGWKGAKGDDAGGGPARQSPDGSSRMAGGGLEKIILLVMFGGFLLLGFFDHYFFSLNQGGLMFWLVAGLLVARPSHMA